MRLNRTTMCTEKANSSELYKENGNIDRQPKLALVSKFDNGFVPGVAGTGVVPLGLVLEEGLRSTG